MWQEETQLNMFVYNFLIREQKKKKKNFKSKLIKQRQQSVSASGFESFLTFFYEADATE
jgi:hypothetical protein